MKKIHLTPKAKKVSVITGTAVLCLGVLSVVLFQNDASSKVSTSPASSASSLAVSSETVYVNPVTANDSSISHPVSSSAGGTGTFDPGTQKNVSEPLTTISKPTSAPPKPIIEGDSKNGSQPTNPVLTDKSKKPTYTTQPKAPASSSTTKTSDKTSSSPKAPSKTPDGSTDSGNHAGEAYDPVFGWTKSTGGQGTTVGNPGDQLTGDKVGIMD